MALHPQARAAAEAAAGDVPVWTPGYDVAARRDEQRREAAQEPREPVTRVEDLDAAGVPCRLYAHDGAPAGLVVHLHGGGFVFGDVEVHDAVCRRLARRSGLAVLSVDYRRPPEHRFPAAPDDVDRVVAWLDAEGPARGLAVPTAVHGDSAGANLALGAALRHPGRFAAAALVYPFLDPDAVGDSYESEATALDRRTARWYWDQYAATEADLAHPDLAPLRSPDLASLPPTLVVTAEHDPLVDEGELLARRLAELGVAVVAVRYLGMTHGFWRHSDQFDAADPLTVHVGTYLAGALAGALTRGPTGGATPRSG